MAIAEDLLVTRLELLGFGAYLHHLGLVAGAIGNFEHSLNAAQRAQLNFGLAAAVVGLAAVEFLHKAAEAAGEEDAVFGRAAITFKSFGNAFPREEIEAFAAAQEHLTGVSRETIAAGVGLLGSFNLTKQQAEELTPAILDAAEALKAQGISAEHLSVAVGKAIESGHTEALRRSGIVIKPEDVARLGVYRAVLEGVARQGAGAAAEFRRTLPGAVQASESAMHALLVTIGRPLVGPLTLAAELVTKIAYFFERVPGAGEALAVAMVGVATAATVSAVQTGIMLYNLTRAKIQAAQVAAGLGTAGGAGAGALIGRAGIIGAAVVGGLELGRFLHDQFGFDPLGGLRDRFLGGEEHKDAVATTNDLLQKQLEELQGMKSNLDKLGGKQIRGAIGDEALLNALARGIA